MSVRADAKVPDSSITAASTSGDHFGLPPRYVRRVVAAVTIVGAGVAVVLLLWFQIHVLLLGFAGALLAIFLYTISQWVHEHTRLRYWVCLTLVCLCILAIIGGLVWLTEARIETQVSQLQQQVPKAVDHLQDYLSKRRWGQWLIQRVRTDLSGTGISAARTGVSTVVWYVAEAFVILFVGLFGAISYDLYVRGFVQLLPLGRPRDLARECIGDLRRALWWWLVGQMIAMVFIGVVTAVAVWLLGVPLAMTLGLLAGLLNFIPNFGPLLAAIPAILMAILHSPMLALWVAVTYLVIQIIQNHVVTPLTQQKVANLPPILLMLSQIFMYYWDGALGMLLAPPLTLVVIRLVQILYLKQDQHLT